MTWFLLILLIALAIAFLRMTGVRSGMLQACAAALLFGAVGYAIQGRPGLSGAPAEHSAKAEIIPLTGARHAFYGDFTAQESWLRMSEGLAQSGNSADAVNILQNAVRRYPGEPQLWIGLGNALVDHSQGLTPAAELAYRQATELSPGYPGPLFFYGLALARSGDRQAALTLWRGILADAPEGASWRSLVEGGVAALGGSRRPVG